MVVKIGLRRIRWVIRSGAPCANLASPSSAARRPAIYTGRFQRPKPGYPPITNVMPSEFHTPIAAGIVTWFDIQATDCSGNGRIDGRRRP